jgi:hypothetical protein
MGSGVQISPTALLQLICDIYNGREDVEQSFDAIWNELE